MSPTAREETFRSESTVPRGAAAAKPTATAAATAPKRSRPRTRQPVGLTALG
ncbi:MAG TPA: hypothetical protein VL157_07230 [Gemmatimonadaceae bacterium]|nr:hypothetical protein [Gemmatimonadaceae bacterium]